MPSNKISVILREVIEEFINEEFSINNKLESAVEIASREFLNKYRGNDIIDERTFPIICGYDGVTYSIPMVTIVCDVSVEDLKNIRCIINVYKVQDEDTIDKIYSELGCGGRFNKYNESVEITIYSVNDGINLQWLRHLMYHECEHAFQFEMSEKILEPTNSYVKAKNIVQKKDIYHDSKIYDDVAWLIYYYSKLEMDANVNGLYGEMMTNQKIKYEDTNFNSTNADMINIFDRIIEGIENEEVQNVINYFDFNPNKFVKYILRQRKYLNDKVKRVMWLIRNKRVSIKENINKVQNTMKHKPLGELIQIS